MSRGGEAGSGSVETFDTAFPRGLMVSEASCHIFGRLLECNSSYSYSGAALDLRKILLRHPNVDGGKPTRCQKTRGVAPV